MRKLILTATTIAALATPGMALAAQPSTASYDWNTNANSQGNLIGVESSQIKQNGPFVSQAQTTYPGSRADIVQSQHALDGIGRDA